MANQNDNVIQNKFPQIDTGVRDVSPLWKSESLQRLTVSSDSDRAIDGLEYFHPNVEVTLLDRFGFW